THPPVSPPTAAADPVDAPTPAPIADAPIATWRTKAMSAPEYVDRVHALQGSAVVTVTFWATWCKYCQEELPILDSVATRYVPKGVAMLIVSVDDRQDEPDDFLHHHPTHLEPIWELRGPDGTRARALATLGVEASNSLPRTLVFRKSGQLAAEWKGTRSAADIQHELDRLLAERR